MNDPILPGNDSSNNDEIFDFSKLEDENPNPQEKDSKSTKPGTTPSFKIAEKFSHLPEKEAIIRTAQAMTGRLSQEVNRLYALADELQPYKRLFDTIEEDADYRKAFIKHIEPDLVKQPQNVTELVKAQLTKEYPDFTPNPSEGGIYGTPTFDYNRRAQQLEQEFGKGLKEIPELKELVEKRKAVSQTKSAAVKKEIEDLKAKFGWDDTAIENMFKTFKGMSITNMGITYNFMTKKGVFKSPTSVKSTVPKFNQTKIDEILGPKISGPDTWKK